MSVPGGDQATSFSGAGDAMKISMLKKAVLSLTSQKAELESDNKKLAEKLAMLGETLSAAHETENQLREELHKAHLAIEELRREKSPQHTTQALPSSSGSAGGASASVAATFFKGILGSSAAPQTSAALHTAVSKTSSPAVKALPPPLEPMDALQEENESLHMQLFDLRTELEQERARSEAALNDLKLKVVSLEAAAAQWHTQRREIEIERDRLMDEVDECRVQEMFCRTFLRCSSAHITPPIGRLCVAPIEAPIPRSDIPTSLFHDAQKGIRLSWEYAEMVTSAAVCIAFQCRDAWALRRNPAAEGQSPEAHQMACYAANLQAKRDALMIKLKSLRDVLTRDVAVTPAATDVVFVAHLELDVLACWEAFLGAILQCLHLVVDAAVPVVGRTCFFRVPTLLSKVIVNEGGSSAEALSSRDHVVEVLEAGLRREILRRRSVAGLLQRLIANRAKRGASSATESLMSGACLPIESPSWSHLWLDGLILAECHVLSRAPASTPLAGSSGPQSLGDWVSCWLEVITDSELTKMLQNFSSLLQSRRVWKPLRILAGVEEPLPPQNASCRNTTDREHSEATSFDNVYESAAVQYFTQWQHALIELLDVRKQLESTARTRDAAQRRCASLEEELRDTSEAFEEQIRLLSEKLAVIG